MGTDLIIFEIFYNIKMQTSEFLSAYYTQQKSRPKQVPNAYGFFD